MTLDEFNDRSEVISFRSAQSSQLVVDGRTLLAWEHPSISNGMRYLIEKVEVEDD